MHSSKSCCDGLDNSNKEESVREYNTSIPTLFLMTFLLVLWDFIRWAQHTSFPSQKPHSRLTSLANLIFLQGQISHRRGMLKDGMIIR